jgi:hypothetical protein
MPARHPAQSMLSLEARALLTRLARVQSFMLHVPMVTAAAISLSAQAAIERYLAEGRRELRELVRAYLAWLGSAEGRLAGAAEAQRRFTVLRLRFNVVLSQFDIFADVLTQRCEHDHGVWLAGLDALAADALELPGDYYRAPPVITYLDRGAGASIRRARTRLPGGGENPVAIVRVPRERMIGSGIGSSLVHEVGHQGAALLDLVKSLRVPLKAMQEEDAANAPSWALWDRWISEIVSDFWSVARLGIDSTVGLMGVVSLPRPFVFRVQLDDPHPFPWIRVKLSCAIGDALYPHPQWRRLARLWEAYYPLDGLDARRRRLVAIMDRHMPRFVALLVDHRPPKLRGASLREVMAVEERQPPRLAALYDSWRSAPERVRVAPPSLVMAVIGQAKADGMLGPEEESRLVERLLRYWALRRTLDAAPMTAARLAASPLLRAA